MSLVRNTSWSAAGGIVNAIGRLAIAAILARRLGPALFGLFVFVQWLNDMTFLVYSVGLPAVATRFFPQSLGSAEGQFPGFRGWFLRAGALATLLVSIFAAIAAMTFSGVALEAPLAGVALWAALQPSMPD